jgi:hypothetical protein
MEASDEILKAYMYLRDPNSSRDLSGLKFGIEGVKRVASFLSKW